MGIYYLKLENNFFSNERIKWIEKQENGAKYVLIYLKLCADALVGLLDSEENTLYDFQDIAEITGCDIDTVTSAVKILKHTGLVSEYAEEEDMTYYINLIEGMRFIRENGFAVAEYY